MRYPLNASRAFGSPLGCGPSCSCAPCRSPGPRAASRLRAADPERRFPGSALGQDAPPNGGCQPAERRIRLPPAREAAPQDLVEVAPRHRADPNQTVTLHRDAYAAYALLKAAAERDGIPPPLLTLTSGYRSVASQWPLWQDALRRWGTLASRYVAPPGSSPHHTGRALDLWLGVRFGRDPANIPAIAATPAHRWLLCNAPRFGFTPYRNEPWHWEYNPASFPVSTPPLAPPDLGPRPPRNGAEYRLLAEAASRGQRNVNALTSILFYARHPERRGQPLARSETALIAEWIDIRDGLVRPFLARTAAPTEAPW